MPRTIVITGGAGFIGSHVVRQFVTKYPEYTIINVDKLTYAGNLENLSDLEKSENYLFEKIDIVDPIAVNSLFEKYKIDGIIHLAAESHVDRSITNPMEFIYTNIVGTVNLLNSCRKHWQNNLENKLFYHISTDEVYGSLEKGGLFTEGTSYDPRSPYSASKAGSDHFVRAYHNTFDLPVVISNCSNNYGPNQFPEKLVPLVINNINQNKPIPVYGKGENIRDWLFVIDHAQAIDLIYHKGKIGETYNIGGNNEWKNIELITLICKIMDNNLGQPDGSAKKLITFV
jgi:dTDP-glucose 4,6-dehydratase